MALCRAEQKEKRHMVRKRSKTQRTGGNKQTPPNNTKTTTKTKSNPHAGGVEGWFLTSLPPTPFPSPRWPAGGSAHPAVPRPGGGKGKGAHVLP